MSKSTNGVHGAQRTLDGGQPTGPEGRGERRLISPFRCRVWAQHARPEEQLTENACTSLRRSIEKNGQHQAVLGRPVTDDPDYDIELICGARRHAVALALRRDLLVEVRVLSDAEAYVAMYEENAQRKDDCPYVQGQILRRAMLSQTCTSQEDLARAFSLSSSKVSRLLMVAQLPSVLVAAFHSPDDIRESWGVQLYQLWINQDHEHALTARARGLANRNPRPSAREVYDTLITAPVGKPASHRLTRNVPVRGSSGQLLFFERDRVGNITFIVPKALLNAVRRRALRQMMTRVLDTDGPTTAPDRE